MLNTLVLGLIQGSIYALISMGLSIQYGVARILNIAHGEFIMVGAFLTWTLTSLGLHPLLALVICCPFILIVGFALHRTAFKRLKTIAKKPELFENNAMLLAFGLMYIIQNIGTRIWGSNPMRIPFMAFPVSIGTGKYPANGLLVFGIAAVISVAFYFFLMRTRLGKSIRAASQDPVSAGLMGIKINTIMAVCFGIGAMLAGIAGSLLSVYKNIYTTMGMENAVIAIIVVVLGGLGSVSGSIIGGVLLGLIGTLVTTYYASLMLVVFYAIIMILLLVKPKGLMGR